ncbi:hypothetical protein PHYBLDRAFT_64677 [Phycomyces blakesleeanus NRRL 1555(-)]|uniref:F-box domain-containing protein n=1 Tax=Phycomyces blakesleeanus (strain ATCC 8743b / DSM 1359 / FGSC 10004 / NBRC 33097 / NRRL 1555) TaxID=763407 RepID=A0A162UAU8_PHYB8|nr:hypothetical protein PHYBLDRAFT_64677 [Phycomyces blakesleeanus NRRL 1555(-)]OAD73723.1 hypothetical protein PHYBLDRAFT_64677 [Phycomyces blakesleeanus NRRL 1555(-)]|eukprot:XP_018291763.1 hypothetical protein PHYBLDRAFT_64677 [Phycomyces blakesleeanus NRRL 1555(-)]
MLASELPFEILSQIASFLSKPDQCNASSVCRAWKRPFNEEFWRWTDIGYEPGFDRSCCLLLDILGNGSNYGQMVRSLSLAEDIEIHCDILWQLQTYLTGLTYISLPEASLTTSCFHHLNRWLTWSTTLTRLRFCIHGMGVGVSDFLDLLEYLPRLQWLEYTPERATHSLFRLEDVETIHTHLKNLDTLILGTELSCLSPQNLELLSTVQPAVAMTFVKFSVNPVDLRWLYYWAIKYPRLRTLEWITRHDFDPVYMFRDETLLLFSQQDSPFEYLRNLRLLGGIYSRILDKTLIDLLCNFKIALKNIKYETQVGRNDAQPTLQLIEDIMRSSSNTIEDFSLSLQHPIANPRTVPMTFSVCPHLVNLKICGWTTHLGLDLLLDYCVAVKRLDITVDTLSIDSESSLAFFQSVHSMTYFRLIANSVHASVFNYLSKRCKNLQHMELLNVDIVGPQSVENGSMLIDMSFTHFKTLRLNCTNFHGHTIDLDTPNTLINILNVQGVSETRHNWYHIHSNPSNYKYTIGDRHRHLRFTRNLGQKHCKLASTYFNSRYRLMREEAIQRNGRIEFETKYVDKNNWKIDLLRGFTVLSCASIDQFVWECTVPTFPFRC